MAHRNRPGRLGRALRTLVGCLALALVLAPIAEADGGKETERYYENKRQGQKLGHSKVVWAPSTWEGKKTLHDTSTHVSVSVRNMMGVLDRFETTQITDIERSEDGTLWWRRDRVEEPGRVTVSELTWTGKGYRSVAKVEGEKDVVIEVASAEPVMTDAESFLGPYIRGKKLEAGQKLALPQLDIRARKVRNMDIEVVGEASIPDENGKDVKVWKFVERDPKSRSEMTLWIDMDGALVRLVTDGGFRIDRTTKDKAQNMPVKAAQMRITTPSTPGLDRIFSADRMLVDVGIQHDADRKLPEFPDSPWSRTLERVGSAEQGWTYRIECRKYDDPAATVKLPVTDEKYARQLEATVLMQTEHPEVKAVVAQVLDGETDGRKAAVKLARFVYSSLRKTSAPVAQASAVEILEQRCGDCSEHALLFTALCRAAGIPARRCTGYVNIGDNWGAHAWCEIWLGKWVGADPTTGEVGQGARYLFFGYPEEPDSYPGVVSSRISGRIRFVSTRIEEGDQSLDLTDDTKYRLSDPAKGAWLHALTGIEARGVPSDYTVTFFGKGLRFHNSRIRVTVAAFGDQGADMSDFRDRMGRGPAVTLDTTFGGAPAILRRGGGTSFYLVHSRRRIVQIQISGATPSEMAEIETWLTPGLQARPLAWPPEDKKAAEPAAPKKDDTDEK